MNSFTPYLDLAIRAARAAGDLLRADFHLPTGPRGEGDKAPVDTEAEQVVRDILLGAGGDWGFLGEETGSIPAGPGAPIWVVDPNDGTRDYIKGRRGSAVSIGLVWNHRPVLGVVHVFGYPDDRGPVYSAALGQEGVWKNGAPVHARLPEQLTDFDVVLVSGGGDRAARANLQCTKPARVMSIPSIAHRLARVAAGEAAATTSLYSPKTWDFAAGHCLVLAAGGALVDENGDEPVYDDEAMGTSARLFAGSRAVALELSKRNWDLAFRSERETSMPIVRLGRGRAVKDPHLLTRAQGALVGLLVGSALGRLFAGDGDGAARTPDRPAIEAAARRRRLFAGQLGATGEIAVATARSLVDLASDAGALKGVYAAWVDSGPEALDHATASALKGESRPDDLSPVALARAIPLALWGHEAEAAIVATKVREDAALTHKANAAGEAASALAMALLSLLKGDEPSLVRESLHAFARRSGFSREVIDAIVESDASRRTPRAPDALSLLSAALLHLASTTTFEEAMESALAADRTADAVPAIVGAVMGARLGLQGIPERLRTLVLSCRPMNDLAAHPRPPLYWATDAMAMAEALLTAR